MSDFRHVELDLAPWPTSKCVRLGSPFVVNEEARDGSGTGVEVFVGTPDSKVDLSGVKVEGDVSNSMSEIPANDTSLLAGGGSDRTNGKSLASVVLNTREEDEGNGRTGIWVKEGSDQWEANVEMQIGPD